MFQERLRTSSCTWEGALYKKNEFGDLWRWRAWRNNPERGG